MYNREILEKALNLLSEKLEWRGSGPISLVVCGGAGLIILGYVIRTTKDIDIVALAESDGKEGLTITNANPLPAFIREISAEVANDLGLHENWLNNGPADLLKFGLPAGFNRRCHRIQYGNCLTIHFLGRYDQIHLKVYAAVDQGPGKHVQDLLILEPTGDELTAAAAWALTHDSSDGFRIVLKQMLASIGYEDIAARI